MQARVPEAEIYALERGLIAKNDINLDILYGLADVLGEDVEVFGVMVGRDIGVSNSKNPQRLADVIESIQSWWNRTLNLGLINFRIYQSIMVSAPIAFLLVVILFVNLNNGDKIYAFGNPDCQKDLAQQDCIILNDPIVSNTSVDTSIPQKYYPANTQELQKIDSGISWEYSKSRIILMGPTTQVDNAATYVENYLQDIDPNSQLNRIEQAVLDWIPAGEWICDPDATDIVINQYNIDIPETSDITIDNLDTDKVTIIGGWRLSSSTSNYIGANYLEDQNSEKGAKSIIFTPNLDAGIYEVYVNWTAHSNRATNAPIYVNHADGTDIIFVDQTQTVPEPYLLGTYKFDSAPVESIEIRNDGTDGHVIADAVIFRKVDWVEEVLVATASSTFTDRFVNVHMNPNYEVTDSGWVYFSNTAGISNVPAHSSEFWGQWGLQELGLSTGTDRTSETSFTGAGVTMGIFDASPYTTEGTANFNKAPLNFNMDVVTYEISESNVITAGGQNHGLAVASLIHTVAPEAEIQLHRILTTKTKGDLFSLINALSNFIESTNGPAVINLSLGILNSGIGSLGLSCNNDVSSLKTVLHAAYEKGIVTVAASGNNGKASSQIPAIWDWVIDVSATQPEYELAGYSNHGSIAAPGGAKADCRNNPELCMVGTAELIDTGYAYWTGTSFAAPLVSGLAALYMEQSGISDPDQIRNMIMSSVKSGTSGNGRGAGVIQLSCDNSSHILFEEGVCNVSPPLPEVSVGDYVVNQNVTVTVPISVTNIPKRYSTRCCNNQYNLRYKCHFICWL